MQLDAQAQYKSLLRLQPLRFLKVQFAKNGDVFETRLPDGTRRFATRSPEHTMDILVRQARSFGRIDNPIEPVLLQGLLISEGERWKRRRVALQPRFKRAVVETLRSTLESVLDAFFAEDFPRGRTEDFYRCCKELTLKGTVCSLFSPDAYQPALIDVLDTTMMLTGAVRIQGARGGAPAQFVATRDALTAHVEHILDAPNRRPFLQGMLDTNLSREEIAEELRSVLLGGQDTLSSVLLWATRLMSEHPPARSDWIVEETLRLHTPLYAFPRRCLERVQMGEWVIEAGDEVVAWPHIIHRDPRWWDEPEAFRPERWATPPEPGTYVPFSLGSHNCLGKHFARLFMVAVVERLKRFDFTWPEPPPRCVPLITMVPTRDVPVHITER